MSWDGGRSRSGAVIVGFRNGDRIARVSPDSNEQSADLTQKKGTDKASLTAKTQCIPRLEYSWALGNWEKSTEG